jgi:hypothetical protein
VNDFALHQRWKWVKEWDINATGCWHLILCCKWNWNTEFKGICTSLYAVCELDPWYCRKELRIKKWCINYNSISESNEKRSVKKVHNCHQKRHTASFCLIIKWLFTVNFPFYLVLWVYTSLIGTALSNLKLIVIFPHYSVVYTSTIATAWLNGLKITH